MGTCLRWTHRDPNFPQLIEYITPTVPTSVGVGTDTFSAKKIVPAEGLPSLACVVLFWVMSVDLTAIAILAYKLTTFAVPGGRLC